MKHNENKSNLGIWIAVICLVFSCGTSIYINKTAGSIVTNQEVLAVSNPQEFVAIVEGTYADGVLSASVETNAPNGSIFEFYVQHPDFTEPLSTRAVIEQGVAEVIFQIDPNLATNFLVVNSVLDMQQQETKKAASVTTKRYGEYGEKMVGNNIFTEDNLYYNGVSNIGIIPYPSKEAVREIQNVNFGEYMYYLCQSFPEIFYAIKPNVESGEWDEITVVLSEVLTNTGWENITQEQQESLFSIFESAPREYYLVDDDTPIKVTLQDINGNVVDKNY